MSSKAGKNSIAVIGLACWYPGASTPLQFWENILARRRQFRQMPDCRLPLSDYYHPDPSFPDKTYGRKAAVIDGFEFDWAAMRIPLTTFNATDISHWLALETAISAVTDAGYTRKSIPGQHTGVIIGNTLTGEQTRSNTLRMRWPYFEKTFKHTAADRGLSSDRIEMLSKALEHEFKSAFPPVTEDTLAGGLSNTIAGRICNYLNLLGGGYTIDGACSSSLLAIANAASRLTEGDLDLAIAGGVDISLDPFELIGFAKTGALTKNDMTVYDRRGSGFLPGEGCGFVILKRLADARKDKNEIYAVLNGWGISSDGGGAGITAPSAKGQSMAIRKAYETAPYGMDQLDFIEGHGTGTTVGDRAELEGISLAMQAFGNVPARNCGMTSLKSLIGHTKAASGIGGFIKATMAVNRRVIPPTAACRLPHPAFDTQAKALYPAQYGSRKDDTDTLRAGVSAMGFGGINCHVTLSSADPPNAKLASDLGEEKLMASTQDTELFVLSANTAAGLEKRIQEAMAFTREISQAEMSDLAAALARQSDRAQPLRAAIVADSPDTLHNRWDKLLELLNDTPPSNGNSSLRKDDSQMVWFSRNTSRPKIGFLFPGQGSQQLNMGAMLAKRFSWAEELIQTAVESVKEFSDIDLPRMIYRPIQRAVDRKEIDGWSKELARTEVAQPAICLGSLLWLRLLRELGITPAAVGGHSLGEVTAFAAAGAFDESALLRFAALRGQTMSQSNNNGAMVSLKCPRERAEALIDDITDYLILSNINSPTQMVLSGEVAAVDTVIRLASAEGILAHRLNVSNAFHSRLAAPAAEAISNQTILPGQLDHLKCRLFSSTDGREIETGVDLSSHFAEQLKSQVNFIDMVKAMSEACDLMIEVGPGQVLTGLVRDIQNGKPHLCLPLAATPEGDVDLNRSLAALYASGADIHWPALYENRLVRPFIPPAERSFIENPCEKTAKKTAPIAPAMPKDMDQLLTYLTNISKEEFESYLSARGPFIAQVIQADMNYGWTEGVVTHSPISKPIVPEIKIAFPAETESVPAATDRFEALLYELLHDITGFSKETIPGNARLLDDLNLDSIKAGDLLVKFARKSGITWPGDPNILANASIDEIIAAATRMRGEVEDDTTAPSVEALPPDGSPPFLNEAETTRLLFSLVTEITGFPEESLSLEARLTDDLNLDSIKINDLIARVANSLNLNPRLKVEETTQATLNDLLKAFLVQRKATMETPAPTARKAPLTVVMEQAARITGFRLSSIDPDALVERDLHMNPEMLKDLLQRSASLLGTQSQVDLSPLRTRSLHQIASIFERIISREKAGQSRFSKEAPLELLARRSDAWVRNFELIPTLTPLPPLPEHWGKRQEDDWQSANVLVLHRHNNAEVAEEITDQLFQQGAQIKMADFTQAREKKMTEDPAFSHLIAVLPRFKITTQSASEYLAETIAQLSALTAVAPAAQAPRPRTTIAFVTFGGGYFGMDGRFAVLNQCGAAAIGATLHLERTDLRVRVIDFSTASKPPEISQTVLTEIQTPPPFTAAGYDFEMNRRTILPVLSQSREYQPRALNWSQEDVLLVTGGAKGITAACALAAAKATGVRTALVGRSPHPNDRPTDAAGKEILKTLKDFADQGLTAEYFSCDVTDSKAVEKTMAEVHDRLGPVSGVIHGAGLNTPRPARHVSPEKAFEEVSPKVLGMLNLYSALVKNPPKLIVGLSSIIAHTGMPGNAWYGFSNEALELLLQRFAAYHPETQVLAVAYSIWGEEGMGARMGSVSHLAKMGIQAIETRKGVDRFVQLFLNQPATPRVVVTSRLGGLDTWNSPAPPQELPGRYLKTPLNLLPGIESVFTAHLSLSTDPYLKDHLFQGSYLFPTVFGLEAMAQAAVHAAEPARPRHIRIEDIHLDRPITVDPDNGADILIHCVVHERESEDVHITVSAGIIKLNTGIESDYFSARFKFDLQEYEPETINIATSSPPTAIVPQTDLYRNTLLFQGERFQRIETIHMLKQTEQYEGEALFGSRMAPEKENLALAFGGEEKSCFILGDPFFRDTLLQSAALLVPQDTSLPIQIKRLDIFDPQIGTSLSVSARIQLTRRQEKDLVYQVAAVDNNGRVIESLEDYRLRILTHHEEYPTVSDLIDPTRRDHSLISGKMTRWAEYFRGQLPLLEMAYHPGIHDLSKEERHPVELPLIEAAAGRLSELGVELPNDLQIQWLQSGKPVIAGLDETQAGISLSHDERLCICVAGKGATACDIAPITCRSRMTWRDLLGADKDSLIDAMLQLNDTLDQAGTRLWAAGEVLRKLGEKGQSRLEILQNKEDAVLFKATTSSDSHLIFTALLKLTWGPAKILALTFNQLPKKTEETDSASAYRRIYGDLALKRAYDMIPEGPQGQMVFVQRRPLTFKPNAQLSRTIYFSNYIYWMGEVREASVWPIMGGVREQLSTGKWGSVTNNSHIQISGEATVDDMVETRLWASDNSGPEDSTMTLSYDFRKIDPNGEAHRLAFCRMQTTWVEIVGQGLAKARPYPPYLKDFLETMLPRYEAPDLPPPLPESLKGLLSDETDELIYHAPEAPVIVPLLTEHVFETSLSHSNMVGNIYYATYYEWKGQTRDRFFYKFIPDYYRGVGEKGEMICLDSRVDHLREAMPFDNIIVRMSLQTLRRCSMQLHFDFFRLEPDNARIKLAYGTHEAAWVIRDSTGRPTAAPWPEELMRIFKQKIAQSTK